MHLTIALALFLGPTAENGDAARDNFEAGLVALDSGSPLEASDAFEKAAQEAPDWGLAYLQWGIALKLYSPESPDVVRVLKRAVALEPRNARAHFHLAQAYLRVSRQSDAARHLERTLELREGYPDARFLLGRTQAELRDYDAAEKTLGTVLAKAPRHTGAMTTLADIYEKRGRADEAEAMLLRIARAQPEVAYHFVRLARFYDRVGEPKKAKAARAHADTVDPRPKREMRPLRRRR